MRIVRLQYVLANNPQRGSKHTNNKYDQSSPGGEFDIVRVKSRRERFYPLGIYDGIPCMCNSLDEIFLFFPVVGRQADRGVGQPLKFRGRLGSIGKVSVYNVKNSILGMLAHASHHITCMRFG